MVHQDYLPMVGDFARLGRGLSGLPTPWFASRRGINACHTHGGVTIFELLGDDAQLYHVPEALERELDIFVVEAQELSYCIVCSALLLLRLKC